ncbi:serine hydrolase domain-containing protein [Neolewinella persica]|uniref:serine hydrolase domain-containing protein n=1 Tax=Neolewinella persica TaxID=70998 RepID=UPI00039FD8C3|nr:serine hydrolase domain-containing protein [Neolewinella persica]
MILRFPLLALLLLLCTGVRAQNMPTASPESMGFDAERLEGVNTLMQGFVDQGIIPNAQTIVLRRGKVVHRGTFGYADLEKKTPARPNDIYRIASQTKAMVTVALMMEYEQGKFLLEDPLEKYLPAFAKMRVFKTHNAKRKKFTTEPARSSITIRQLLSHTSGISYGIPVETEEMKVPYFASLEDDTLEDVANRIAKRPLLHQPGEGFSYGLGIDVAGRLLEVISGQTLEEYMLQKVWGPLGMTDSHFYLPAAKHDRLVKLYSKYTAEAPLTLHENETYRDFAIKGAQTYFSAGAGSVGTIDDYARFCQLMLNRGTYNGVRLLAPKTVDMMLKNQIGDAEVWDRKDKFGLGFQLITAGTHYGDQARPGAFTWGGLYCSEYFVDPEEELVMLVYTNVHPIPQYGEVVRKFRVAVYAALME